MADTLEGVLTQAPGLSYYLSMKKAVAEDQMRQQQQGLQQQFLESQQQLGPNATPEQRTKNAMGYVQNPTAVIHYGLQNQVGQARVEAAQEANKQKHEYFTKLLDKQLEMINQTHEYNMGRLKDQEAKNTLTQAKNQAEAENKRMRLELDRMLGQQNADIRRLVVEQKTAKQDEPLQTMLDKIDATIRAIQQNPEAVGGRGMIGRGMEFIGSTINPGQETPASNLQSRILDVQTHYRGLPGHAASRLKVDQVNIDNAIKGLGLATSADQALGSLTTLRESVAKQLERRGGASAETPAATPQPAPAASARQANTVYMTPRGPLKWTGTGWVPP